MASTNTMRASIGGSLTNHSGCDSRNILSRLGGSLSLYCVTAARLTLSNVASLAFEPASWMAVCVFMLSMIAKG